MNNKVKISILSLVIIILASFGITRLIQTGKITPRWNLNFPSVSKITESEQTHVILKEENAVIDVAEKSSPSVVAIGVTQRIINPFSPFSDPQSQNNTIGTGWIVTVDSTGNKTIIVTNRHVVADIGAKYSVVTKDGKKLDINKIYRDPNLDLALVEVVGSDLQSLELGDSSKIKVGQTAIAIGNALGRFDNTVTTGVVSGLGRAVVAGDPFSGETEKLENLIQTDAAINPGNSGGPLLNSASQVIGVNVATTEGAQNIGFAIPINSVKAIVDEFSRTGSVTRPYLGIRYTVVTRDVAIMNQLPQGAYVQEIVSGSPADKAGVLAKDIIIKIDNESVNNDTKISEVVQNKKVGDQVTLEIWRDGVTKQVTATLTQSP